jgi:hypothetical protein
LIREKDWKSTYLSNQFYEFFMKWSIWTLLLNSIWTVDGAKLNWGHIHSNQMLISTVLWGDLGYLKILINSPHFTAL